MVRLSHGHQIPLSPELSSKRRDGIQSNLACPDDINTGAMERSADFDIHAPNELRNTLFRRGSLDLYQDVIANHRDTRHLRLRLAWGEARSLLHSDQTVPGRIGAIQRECLPFITSARQLISPGNTLGVGQQLAQRVTNLGLLPVNCTRALCCTRIECEAFIPFFTPGSATAPNVSAA
jgi:hypothetical protein